MPGLHMIKLCVGCESVEQLLDWHRAERRGHRPWIMSTRMSPKRAEELLDGGSLYRVYKGMILSRQRILGIETIGSGPASRCEVTLDLEVVRVAATPRRAFQGWRYLKAEDAPPDLGDFADEGAPPELAQELRALGAW